MAPSTTRVRTVAEGRAQRARGEHDHEAADRGAPGRSAFDLALFDLDFTLIPSDSGLRWARFMVAEGVLPGGSDEAYLNVCRSYVAGRIDIETLHAFAARTLLAVDADAIPGLQARFEAAVRAELPAAARDLVAQHLEAGELCCIVTTTNEIVARPYARAFGIPNLLASVPACEDGRFCGAYVGALCHGAGKVARVEDWLRGSAAQGGVSRPRRSIFYSDSASDLPLLEWADEAVAVRPDARLRAHAELRGWRIIDAPA